LHAHSNRNPRFALGSLGGRWVLFCAIADLQHADAKSALDSFAQRSFDEAQRLGAIFSTESGEALAQIAETKLIFTDRAKQHPASPERAEREARIAVRVRVQERQRFAVTDRTR
jgi:hypothetical protein